MLKNGGPQTPSPPPRAGNGCHLGMGDPRPSALNNSWWTYQTVSSTIKFLQTNFKFQFSDFFPSNFSVSPPLLTPGPAREPTHHRGRYCAFIRFSSWVPLLLWLLVPMQRICPVGAQRGRKGSPNPASRIQPESQVSCYFGVPPRGVPALWLHIFYVSFFKKKETNPPKFLKIKIKIQK